MVFKVNSDAPPDPVCGLSPAIGDAVLFEPLTKRPIFGQIRLCTVSPANFLINDLQFVLHDMLHALVCRLGPHFTPATLPPIDY